MVSAYSLAVGDFLELNSANFGARFSITPFMAAIVSYVAGDKTTSESSEPSVESRGYEREKHLRARWVTVRGYLHLTEASS